MSCWPTRSAFPDSRWTGTCCGSPTASASPHSDDPEVVEQQLGALYPPKDWRLVSDTLILHGRRVCNPKPLCDRCSVRTKCDAYQSGAIEDERTTATARGAAKTGAPAKQKLRPTPMKPSLKRR